MATKLTRRKLLVLGASAALAAPVLAACGSLPGSQPAPTTASQGQATPAAKSAPAGQKATVRMLRFAGAGWEQDVQFVEEFAKAHPNIEVKPEDVPYGEMNKKILTLAATGTLADMFPGHTRWNGQIRGKGIPLDLDPLIKTYAKETNFDDFFPSVIDDIKGPGSGGKVMEFPTIVHPGGNIVVLINLEHVEKAGAKVPDNNDWTTQNLEELARAAARPKEGVFGLYAGMNSPLYSTQVTRSWSTDPNKASPDSWVLSPDGKQSQLGLEPVKTAFEWYHKMTKDGLTPTSDLNATIGSGQNFFTAGKVVAYADIVGSVENAKHVVGDRFKWTARLWPKGPNGHRGTCLSYNTFALYSKTKVPDEAYQLLVNQTSSEVGLWAGLEGKANPYARKSIWSNPKLHEKFPITKDVLSVFEQGIAPFPMPWNLLAQEYQDTFQQNIQKYVDGKEDWDQMYEHTQKAVQEVLDRPRP